MCDLCVRLGGRRPPVRPLAASGDRPMGDRRVTGAWHDAEEPTWCSGGEGSSVLCLERRTEGTV